MNNPAQQGAPTTNGAPEESIGDKAEKFWKRTGLSDGRWKWKLPILAGVAGGAYGAYRVGKAGLNWLDNEVAPAQYGNQMAQPAQFTNEYGYAQR